MPDAAAAPRQRTFDTPEEAVQALIEALRKGDRAGLTEMLVAFPAQYGNSGVMTFIASHDGAVYQKDLGPQTAAVARRMSRFDPDNSWTRVAP